jgi:ABC-type uncharacterized transport system permease subunit
MDRVNFVCILASYVAALGLDVAYQRFQWFWLRAASLVFGTAGFLAQTIYLGVQRPDLSWQGGWLLGVAWLLAIFYLVGTLHHPRLAWGIFVLPVVVGLVLLSVLSEWVLGKPPPANLFEGEKIFAQIHKWLLLLATVGLAIGCVSSLMYLVQASRLRAKKLPGLGFRLLSAERLETMVRRAIVWTFPVLTIGMLLGLVMMFRDQPPTWTDPRVLASLVLWVVFALLLYLRLRDQVGGRQTAYLTLLTFGLMLLCLILAHPSSAPGGGTPT